VDLLACAWAHFEGIPKIEFVAQEVECILRERRNELESVKTWCPKHCETIHAPPRLSLGLFEVPCQFKNDTENR